MSLRPGLDFRFWISETLMTDNNGTGAVWVEVGNAQSTEISMTRESQTATIRGIGGGGQRVSTGSALQTDISIELAYDDTDTAATKVIQALKANTEIAFADVVGDPDVDGKGSIGNFLISSITWPRPEETSVITIEATAGAFINQLFDAAA